MGPADPVRRTPSPSRTRRVRAHYHVERNHQGLGNVLIAGQPTTHTRGPDSATAATGWTTQLLRARRVIESHNSTRRFDRVVGHYGCPGSSIMILRTAGDA